MPNNYEPKMEGIRNDYAYFRHSHYQWPLARAFKVFNDWLTEHNRSLNEKAYNYALKVVWEDGEIETADYHGYVSRNPYQKREATK